MATRILRKPAAPAKAKPAPVRPYRATDFPGQKQAPSVRVFRDELIELHDIAAALSSLKDIADSSPEMKLVQVEIIIKKAADSVWELIHEELDSRWRRENPRVPLFEKGGVH